MRAANPAFWVVTASALLALALSLGVPALRHLFRFEPLPWPGVLVAMAAPWLAGFALRGVMRAVCLGRGAEH